MVANRLADLEQRVLALAVNGEVEAVRHLEGVALRGVDVGAAERDGKLRTRLLQERAERQRGDELRRHQAEADQIRLHREDALNRLVYGHPLDVRVQDFDLESLATQQGSDVKHAKRLQAILGLLSGQQRRVAQANLHDVPSWVIPTIPPPVVQPCSGPQPREERVGRRA